MSTTLQDELNTKKCRAITVSNARGGCGKTFLSIHLAYMLAERGDKVLLIDTDPQGTVSKWLRRTPTASLYNFIMGESGIEDTIVKYGPMDVILSDDSIKEAELNMVGMFAREFVLQRKLSEFEVYERYNYVIIDTSPSLSLLNQNAYLASNEVLIPINMEPLAIVGAGSIVESIKLIRKLVKHKLSLLGVVPTFVSRQSNVAKQVLSMITGNYDSVLPQIRASVKVKEASGMGKTLNEYDPQNAVIEDLKHLTDAIRKKTLKV